MLSHKAIFYVEERLQQYNAQQGVVILTIAAINHIH